MAKSYTGIRPQTTERVRGILHYMEFRRWATKLLVSKEKPLATIMSEGEKKVPL